MSNDERQKALERLTDWSPDTVEMVEPAAPPQPASPSDPVQYEKDKVTAYFDDTGRSCAPHFATWAKVWLPDGSLTIVTFDGQEATRGG